ncbi:hypothetical protein WDU94_010958 [Cyamophila willieti]
MSDLPRWTKEQVIEKRLDRVNSTAESIDNRTNVTNKTVELESLKFALLFNRTHTKELNTDIDKDISNKLTNSRSKDNEIVNEKEKNDFDRDSLDRIRNLNIDKDSLDGNVETDSLDEIESDSLNNVRDERLNEDSVVDIEQSPNFEKSDTDIFVNSSNIDKSESEIFGDILKTIQNSTTHNNSDSEIIEDSPNKISYTDIYDAPNVRNSNEVFERTVVNERSIKESRAALASEIQSGGYTYDKFDRFFSAIDFFEEPPNMQRVPDKTIKNEKPEGGGGSGFPKKKIPILSNTIARNERRKVSYLEQYKKKCSKKLKKVMKDTETKTVENRSSIASDLCSVSSKHSVGNASSDEIEDSKGKGDHESDDEQYYYDAITKYEHYHSNNNGASETLGSGSNIASERIPSTSNHSYGSNIPSRSCIPSERSIPNRSSVPSVGNITNETNIPSNTINARQSNLDRIDGLHKNDSKSARYSNNSIKDVKLIYLNKAAGSFVNDGGCQNGNTIRKSERFDIEGMQNDNPMRKKAHSVQNVGPTRPVHKIPSQKSMPIYHSQVQQMHISKTQLQSVPTAHQTIDQRMSCQNNTTIDRDPVETHSNFGSHHSNFGSQLSNLGSQNSMSNYPASVQNIAKVYPLSRVFPHRRTESCGPQTSQIHALREANIPSKTTTCQSIPSQKSITRIVPSQQEVSRNSSNQFQRATSTVSRASLTKNQPTKSTSNIVIRNTVKPTDLSQHELNRNTNSNQSNFIQKAGPTTQSRTRITTQQPTKNSSSMLIRTEKPSTKSSVRENIQAFEQKSRQEELVKQNIRKEMTVKTMKTSQQFFPKSRQESKGEISSKEQQSQTQISKNAHEKSEMCLPQEQSQKSATKLRQKESIGKPGKQESQQKLSMQQKSQLKVSETQLKSQQNLLKPVQSNQQGITRSQKSSQQEMTRSHKLSQQEIEQNTKMSQQAMLKSPKISKNEINKSQKSSQQELTRSHKLSQQEIAQSTKMSQQAMFKSPKISKNEINISQKSSLQELTRSHKLSQQNVSKPAPNDQQEMASSPRSEDTDSVSVHTQTLSDKSTQFEDIYQDSLDGNIEIIHPKPENKRPATTSDNRQRMPHPAAEKFRHLSRPRRSYVELYQQKIISKKIPVPISKLNLKPRRVEQKVEVKKSTPVGGWNTEQQRKGKVTPRMMDDSAKAGGEGTKVGTPKQPLKRYNLKKKVVTPQEEIVKPDKVVLVTKSKPVEIPVEEDQEDLQLKMLEEKREQLQKQLRNIKSRPRAAVLHNYSN